ncbi:uncharacterized protein MAM_01618 [Metarhizium album ARSEF 1941]|uniref:Uncharacterized protein n=1 Tax=Metarhizium album (strain ARSEF 1941) TaxID=1081103 RepID=A0A0B2X5W8_METAS|nr:uncharacterized protein MAM_01618 [Metarhizium album ARSEF 1941]KHO00840.1 hypothetical protein MAM_01618 [Metarhizium album ARSEF 1941]
MTTPKAKDPLDALQLLVNDVLVQTGKALRASRRDSQGNLPPSQGLLQPKLPDTIRAFHSALDDLENDIIRAKSVLLRDLNQLKAQNHSSHESRSLAQPTQAVPQTKSPMAIDIDSSPQVAPKEEPIDQDGRGNKPGGAPIPDMGLGLGLDLSMSDSPQPPAAVKEEDLPSEAPGSVHAASSGPVKTAGKEASYEAPMAQMDVTLEGTQTSLDGGGGGDDAVLDLTNPDLNFTDMEFTLAPTGPTHSHHPGGGGGNAGTTTTTINSNNNPPEPSFDLASFDAADGATGNMSSLVNMLPPNAAEQPAPTANAPQGQGRPAGGQPSTLVDMEKKGQGQGQGPTAEPAPADVFTGDGQADGMDFDFSLGDGMGGDTFDDLMNDRDNTFDAMEHGDFDANFFGLDKVDDA